MRRPLLRRLLTAAGRDLGRLLREDYDGQTDEEIADLLIDLADASLPLGFVPGAGPVLEALDGRVLRRFRGRVGDMVAAARARLSAAGSPS